MGAQPLYRLSMQVAQSGTPATPNPPYDWVPPSYWYDNQEFDQAGSHFGAKKANEPMHALYGYDTHTVTLDNLTNATEAGLSVQSKVCALDEQSAGPIALGAQAPANDVLTPRIPATTPPPAHRRLLPACGPAAREQRRRPRAR